jgi:hypothetical protein
MPGTESWTRKLCLPIGAALLLSAASAASARADEAPATTVMSIDEADRRAPGPLSRIVLEYSRRFKEVTDRGGKRPIVAADWDRLGELLDKTRFERIGSYDKAMGWSQYLALLNGFANRSTWDGKVRRITEVPGRVYLELVESGERRDGSGGFVTNTLTVYEFDKARKLRRLWVYTQQSH